LQNLIVGVTVICQNCT